MNGRHTVLDSYQIADTQTCPVCLKLAVLFRRSTLHMLNLAPRNILACANDLAQLCGEPGDSLGNAASVVEMRGLDVEGSVADLIAVVADDLGLGSVKVGDTSTILLLPIDPSKSVIHCSLWADLVLSFIWARRKSELTLCRQREWQRQSWP